MNKIFSGSPEQIRYLVSLGCIPPICDLLTVMDSKIIQVALSGLENILRIGEMEAENSNDIANNPYANQVEECYGLDKIEFLQSHENMEIYQRAFDIIERYFGSDENDTDAKVAPPTAQAGAGPEQFQFQAGGNQGQFSF